MRSLPESGDASPKDGGTLFAVPALCGYRGRAVYNDVNCIYMCDPAELFDINLEGWGFRSVSPLESSVMVIDCERMAQYWTLQAAQRGGKRLLNRAREMHGTLDPAWTVPRDEHVPGQSRVVLLKGRRRRQRRLWSVAPVRREQPFGDLRLELEHSADRAGFLLFTRDRPSRRFQRMLDLYATMHVEGVTSSGLAPEQTFPGQSLRTHIEPVEELVSRTGASTILDYGSGKGGFYKQLPGEASGTPWRAMPAWGESVRVRCYDPGYPPFAALPGERFDGVVCTDVLEHVPEDDVAWIVDELFAFARRFVYASAACYPAAKNLPNGENAHCTVHGPDWWQTVFESASRRHPDITWQLAATVKRGLGRRKRSLRYTGGCPPRAQDVPTASSS